MKTLLIVTQLDYKYFANNRVHHIVEQFKNKFDGVTVLYRKVCVLGEYSFLDQFKILMTFKTKIFYKENVTAIEMDPFLNHIDGLGLHILGIESPYVNVRSRFKSFVKRALSNMGFICDCALILSFILAFILRVRRKIDVFIGQGPLEAAAGFILKKIGLVKVLVYDDFDYAPGYQHAQLRKMIIIRLENFLLKRSDIVVSIGELLGELRKRETGRRVEIIPNGVNYKLFSKAQEKVAHPPTMIYTGFVWDWSGADIVLRALPIIKKEIPGIRFLVAGHTTPGYLSYIKNISEELGLDRSFVYVGNKKYAELVDCLKQADIGMALFRPIDLRRYAFSLKVIEYMAAGLPVIATKGTQSGAVVENYRCGEAIGFNSEELARCVCSMLADRKKYDTYSRNAMDYSTQYDWESLMERKYELIKTFYSRESHGAD